MAAEAVKKMTCVAKALRPTSQNQAIDFHGNKHLPECQIIQDPAKVQLLPWAKPPLVAERRQVDQSEQAVNDSFRARVCAMLLQSPLDICSQLSESAHFVSVL